MKNNTFMLHCVIIYLTKTKTKIQKKSLILTSWIRIKRIHCSQLQVNIRKCIYFYKKQYNPEEERHQQLH